MKYFLDCEFLENGVTIELISIGLVCEDGRTFYGVTWDGEALCASSEWLMQNVRPKLWLGVEGGRKQWSRTGLQEAILHFVGEDKDPKFYAWYAAYDWVALCQIFGTMTELPEHFPKYVRDVKQDYDRIGFPQELRPIQDPATEHNALADAMWLKDLYEVMVRWMDASKSEQRNAALDERDRILVWLRQRALLMYQMNRNGPDRYEYDIAAQAVERCAEALEKGDVV